MHVSAISNCIAAFLGLGIDRINKIVDMSTHSRRALFWVFDIGVGQIEDILGIILVKEFFKKSN